MNTEKEVIQLLQQLSGTQDVRPEDALQGDIGLDSLGMVTLLVEFESVFSIELKESDMNPFALQTVSDVVKLAARYCGGNHEEGR